MYDHNRSTGGNRTGNRGGEGRGGGDWQIVPIWQHVPSPGFRPDAGHHPAAASIRNSPLMPTRTQPGPSPGRRPPPGCGFPKEQAVKVLGTGRARRKCARGPPANPKGRVLWLTTSTLPGISIDEPCLQRPSELRPPSPGFRPDARPPPGCGFPKELAAEANTYPTQAFTREPDSIRQQFLEEANRKILGAGWTRERVSTWSSGKFLMVGFCGSPPPPGLGLPSTSRASTPF